jgi:hypothetical protein
MMDIFAAHLDTLQSIILSHQYHQDVNKKCPCGAETASYRCEEYFDPPMLCKSCIISAHIKTPLHHIGEWSGTHFNRTSLFALGASLCLGHSGSVGIVCRGLAAAPLLFIPMEFIKSASSIAVVNSHPNIPTLFS